MMEGGVFVDPERGARAGFPEIVLALGKSDAALVEAVAHLLEQHPVLVTRATPQQFSIIEKHFVGHEVQSSPGPPAGILAVSIGGKWEKRIGRCAVISAGSSDERVAEEAAFSLEYLGIDPIRAYDRGVAGLHRLDDILRLLKDKNEERTGVIVVAGMEGALPSVVAGQLKQPVVAVPTSVGYGSSFEGLSALLGMMNSCVPGITVVNIDNGFGAAAAVYRMLKTWSGA